MKSGVVYQSAGGVGAEVRVGVIRNRLRILNRWFLLVAKLSLGTVVVWGGYFWGPVLKEEMKYIWGQTATGRVIERVRNYDLVPKVVTSGQLVTSWTVPDVNYSMYIPKIGAKARVVPDVDPWDRRVYQQALREGVAAAAGLAVPGQKGTTFLFAHSVGSAADFSRYNAIFYLLHRLEVGDLVELVYSGKLHKYRVEEKHILAATDLRFLAPQEEEERVVLQTCYPPGTSWKRLVVVARPIAN